MKPHAGSSISPSADLPLTPSRPPLPPSIAYARKRAFFEHLWCLSLLADARQPGYDLGAGLTDIRARRRAPKT